MGQDPFATGRRISWMAALTVGAAAAFTALTINQGLPGGGDFETRVAHVAESRGPWMFAWLMRMTGAVLTLAFLVALSRTLTPGFAALRSIAVQILALATGAELLAGTLLGVVLPPLAARAAGGESGLRDLVEMIEGIGVVLSAFLGTGLLCVAGALLSHAAARTPPFPRTMAVVSTFVWAAGFLVAGATFSGSTRGLGLMSAIFLPLVAFWAAAVASTHFRPPAGRS
jgi:hypothetical protein